MGVLQLKVAQWYHKGNHMYTKQFTVQQKLLFFHIITQEL